MNELRELESSIGRLKRDSQNRKMLIDALEKEKAELIRRSDDLSQRISQSNESYKESANKIMDYVKSQTANLRMEIAGLSNSMKNLSGLEERVEAGGASHAKAITRLEKEMVAVTKSLSDVDAMRRELSGQKAFVQEAKLQMEKGLQSGIAYLRKELDVNRREEAKKALEQFRQEIGRITTLESELNQYSRAQESRLDRLTEEMSSLKAGVSEIRLLRKRSTDLEETSRSMASALDRLMVSQKTAAATIQAEVSKRTDNALRELKQDLESQRSEDLKTRLKDFKQELGRLASLEQGLREGEKRLDSLGREISSLGHVTEDIRAVREQAEENLHMNQNLADRTVSASDFERTARSVSKRMEELENRIFIVDKKLAGDKERIEKAIMGVLNEEKLLEGTQKNVRSWFDAKFADLEKRVSTGIDALSTQMEEGGELIDRLRQRSQKADIVIRDVPKRLEDHSRAITRLIDSKSGLAASMEALAGDLKGISEGLSQSLQRIAGLEKGLAGSDKRREASSTAFSTELAAHQQELRNQGTMLKELSESARLETANLRTELNSSLRSMEKELQQKASDVAESGLRAIREKTSGLASMRDMAAEIRVLKSSISQLDKKAGQAIESLNRNLAESRKTIDSRLSQITEDQASQFKKEFDYIARNIDSIRNVSSDIKIFSTRLSEMERLSRSLVSEKDFAQLRERVETTISETSQESAKSVASLRKDLEKLAASLESGKVSASDFSKTVDLLEEKIRDIGALSKSSSDELKVDLASLRKAVSDRFNEAKGSQIKDFRNEISRIAQLEKEISTFGEMARSGISDLSKSLEGLQTLPSELGMLKEKITSLEEASGSFARARELSQRMSSMNRSIEKLQGGMASMEKRVRSRSSGLESAINEALSDDRMLKKTQQALAGITESRISDLEKRFSKSLEELARDVSHGSSVTSETMARLSELADLSEQSEDNQSSIEMLKERVGNLEIAAKSMGSRASEVDGMLKRLSKLENLSDSIVRNSEILNSLGEKYTDIGALVKTLPRTVDKHTDAISKILASKETLADTVSGLREEIRGLTENMAFSQEKISGLEKGFTSMSKGAVQEPEFVETVRSVSKRIDNLERLYSGIDKKTGLHEAALDAAVSKAVSREKIIEVSQDKIKEMLDSRISEIEKRFADNMTSQVETLERTITSQGGIEVRQSQIEKSLDSRMNDVESRLSSSISSQVSKLEKGLNEISAIKQDIASLKSAEDHIDADVMSKVRESMSGLSGIAEKSEKRLDGLASELRDISDKLISQAGKSNAVEQRMKAGLGSMESRLKEMIKKEKLSMDAEINEETARLMKEAEVGEMKRKQEFENLLMKFQELHIKTQQNLDDVTKHREGFVGLERSLRDRIDKQSAKIESKTSAAQEMLKKRLVESENMNMKLNNMVSELQMRLERERNTNMDFTQLMSNLKEELLERMKTNEDMFDSEMDAFRNKIDILMSKLSDWKSSKLKPDGVAITKNDEFKVIAKSLEDLDGRLQDNKDEMKKFKEYVTEYMNNLVKTYESRMGRIKEDVEYRLDRTRN